MPIIPLSGTRTANSNTLQRTVNIASQGLRMAPLAGIGGIVNEPALSLGDMVRQTILGPPFAWRWNRKVATPFQTVVGTQDYTQSIVGFGWLEKAVVSDGGSSWELDIQMNLPVENVSNQPVRIAAVLDDNQGNITFRVFPVPDKTYTVTLTYQVAAPLFAALTDTWAPIPDYYSYLYNRGFYAFAYEYMNDARFLPTYQVFLRQLIAAAEGLNETQINIFLADRLNFERTTQALQSTQQGKAGRALA